jgi:hypothetical protein
LQLVEIENLTLDEAISPVGPIDKDISIETPPIRHPKEMRLSLDA